MSLTVTMSPTSKIVEISDAAGGVVPGRIWEGRTARGTPVSVIVTRISPAISNPPPEITAEFEAALKETPPPQLDASRAIPLRMII